MTQSNVVLKFKDGEARLTGLAYLVHYKINNRNTEGSIDIYTRSGLRPDDLPEIQQYLANKNNLQRTDVLIMSFSRYAD